MDIVTTSLDALLHKATNANNQNIDVPALEAFCALINREKDGPHIGAKLLAARIHASNEIEANNSLVVLDTAMKRCNLLHTEIGKFRFLNEMIKLVSPKYLGAQTPLSTKQKVVQLLYLWMLDYPKEMKIKDAYDMLKKQGVIQQIPLSINSDNSGLPERQLGNSVFNDEEKNKVLEKLLRSKNPDDLQAANRLIKNMVKENDKRAELKSRRITELESVHNNARLLNEMLESYRPGVSSRDELDLIKELHQSCERLRPNVLKLISETRQNEELLSEVLQASDELGQVFDKFVDVIIKVKETEATTIKDEANHVSLLDLENLDSTTEHTDFNSNTGHIYKQQNSTDLDLLTDIFRADIVSVPNSILKPTPSPKGNGDISCKSNKLTSLDDLDALGEHLLKENLVPQRIGPQFNKVSEKIPMNLLVKQSAPECKITNVPESSNNLQDLSANEAFNLDLNYLIGQQKDYGDVSNIPSEDDVLVDIIEMLEVNDNKTEETVVPPAVKNTLKLNDISINLDEVKPSLMAPIIVLDEKNGLTVTLHFGKNKPHEDVSVIVVSIISKSDLPISNVLFQAVIAKRCKLKLQQPSGTDLPVYNPFLPPAAITQIMLIANPDKIDISLKFVISYTKDDEAITEMGEVNHLPSIEN